MSPSKRKEKLVHINKEHFKKAIAEKGASQKEIAEKLLFTSEAYFSRRLASGIIDKEWLYKLADYLNVSRSFLTGESEDYLTRLAERKNEINAMNPRFLLNDFMVSRGYESNFCDSLTDSDLYNIEVLLAFIVHTHEDILSNMVSYGLKLEQRIKALEDNNSQKD